MDKADLSLYLNVKVPDLSKILDKITPRSVALLQMNIAARSQVLLRSDPMIEVIPLPIDTLQFVLRTRHEIVPPSDWEQPAWEEVRAYVKELVEGSSGSYLNGKSAVEELLRRRNLRSEKDT